MSYPTAAVLKAASRYFRSAVSQRAEDLLSGRMTPIFALLAAFVLPLVPLELHPATISDDAASAVAAIRNFLRMSHPSLDAAPSRAPVVRATSSFARTLLRAPTYLVCPESTTPCWPDLPDLRSRFRNGIAPAGACPSPAVDATPSPGPLARAQPLPLAPPQPMPLSQGPAGAAGLRTREGGHWDRQPRHSERLWRDGGGPGLSPPPHRRSIFLATAGSGLERALHDALDDLLAGDEQQDDQRERCEQRTRDRDAVLDVAPGRQPAQCHPDGRMVPRSQRDQSPLE